MKWNSFAKYYFIYSTIFTIVIIAASTLAPEREINNVRSRLNYKSILYKPLIRPFTISVAKIITLFTEKSLINIKKVKIIFSDHSLANITRKNSCKPINEVKKSENIDKHGIKFDTDFDNFSKLDKSTGTEFGEYRSDKKTGNLISESLLKLMSKDSNETNGKEEKINYKIEENTNYTKNQNHEEYKTLDNDKIDDNEKQHTGNYMPPEEEVSEDELLSTLSQFEEEIGKLHDIHPKERVVQYRVIGCGSGGFASEEIPNIHFSFRKSHSIPLEKNGMWCAPQPDATFLVRPNDFGKKLRFADVPFGFDLKINEEIIFVVSGQNVVVEKETPESDFQLTIGPQNGNETHSCIPKFEILN